MGTILNTRRNVLDTVIYGMKKNYRMVTMRTGHYGVVLLANLEKEVVYLDDKEEDLTSFQAIQKVHEVNNHKGVDQLLSACSRAGFMSPEVSKEIRRVVHGCRVYQKFTKSVSRPKLTLPKSSTFNEKVTMDLETF